MIYKNSMKIMFSNFDLIWKMVIYYILNFLATSGLLYLCIRPYYDLLESSGLIADAVNIYTDFLGNLNLTQFFASLGELSNNCWITITNNLTQFWLTFIAIWFVIIFFRTIVSGLTIMPMCNSLHYYMGSMNKSGFYSGFAELFWKSLKIQIIQFFVLLPINILYAFLFMQSLNLFTYSLVVSILAIIMIVVGFVLLLALKYLFFAGWIPTMIVMNYSVFKALRASVRNAIRIFPKALDNAIGIILTIILINVIIAPFTFLVGLILTVPASYLIYAIFGMVIVYEGQGMRYYVDVYNVITPQKREMRDKLKEMKFIV